MNSEHVETLREMRADHDNAGIPGYAAALDAAIVSLRGVGGEVCIVCDWKDADPFPRFIEAEVGGKSVSLEWRDRNDGLKELVVPVAIAPQPPAEAQQETAFERMVREACADPAFVEWAKHHKWTAETPVCTGDEIRCHDGHGCECAMREKQPPAEAQPEGGGEVCETCDGAGSVATYVDPYDRGDVSSPEHSPCPACTAPPSAPLGVEGVAIALHRAYNLMLDATDFPGGWPGWQGASPEERAYFTRHAATALAQQPAAREAEPKLDAHDPASGELVAQWLFRNDLRELAAVVRAQLDMRALQPAAVKEALTTEPQQPAALCSAATEDAAFNAGYRSGMQEAAWGVRELYVNHVHHTGAGGLLERCQELEQSLLCSADQQPAAVDGNSAEALKFLLSRIGSWTDARWDQHLRHEFGDARAGRMIAALAAQQGGRSDA